MQVTPLFVMGDWHREARQLIDDIGTCKLADPVGQAAQEALVAALEAHLAVASGERTTEAMARHQETSVTLRRALETFGEHSRRLGHSVSGA
jgi:hypothetical protein